ncbi:MAG: hypothetical protein WEB60_02080 [Terrimicrobiaceae bacterium]
MNTRTVILGVVAIMLASVIAWRWVSGWGLITVNFVDAPLSKVIASLERQSRIPIATNADLETKVTLQAKSAPVFEVFDTLAVRLDGDMRLAYVFAPDKAQVRAGVAAIAGSNRAEGWAVFSSGFGGGMMSQGDAVPDLRRVAFNPSVMEDRSLHALLDQASQKTGVTFAAPKEWNPVVASLPKPGEASGLAKRMASSAKGHVQEVVLLRVQGPRNPDSEEARSERGPREGGQRAGNRPQGNPEWMAERFEAQIALLPKEEQQVARKDFDEMRAFWQQVRALPEEERRAKIEEMMERPEVQERMAERMAARDDKRSPEQRAQRYRRYVERKQQAQSAAQ